MNFLSNDEKKSIIALFILITLLTLIPVIALNIINNNLIKQMKNKEKVAVPYSVSSNFITTPYNFF